MIQKEFLLNEINKYKTQREIAKELNVSQTNIRYWLKKYKLKTKNNDFKTCFICFKKLNKIKRKICKNCTNRIGLLRKKIKLIEFLGGSCNNCNYKKSIAGLDFDHINPKNKKYEISELIRDRSFNFCLKEVRKCKLICSNCHREKHNLAEQRLMEFVLKPRCKQIKKSEFFTKLTEASLAKKDSQ